MTLNFGLEMSCVNSWSEQKAAETCLGVSLKPCEALPPVTACKLVRSGTTHAVFQSVMLEVWNQAKANEDFEKEISGMKGFDKYFVKFSFKTFLKQGAYTKEGFETLLKETPFKNYQIKKEGISLYVYLVK